MKRSYVIRALKDVSDGDLYFWTGYDWSKAMSMAARWSTLHASTRAFAYIVIKHGEACDIHVAAYSSPHPQIRGGRT